MLKNILVIDDDRMVTYALSNLLTKDGYSATASQDGYDALDKVLKKESFDLIVCDLRLPGIDGLETVKKIKEYLKANNKPDVPVIFITGYTDTDLHIRAQTLGKVFFKPFENKELLESIEELIE